MNRKRYIKRMIGVYTNIYKSGGYTIKGTDLKELKKFNLKNSIFKSYDEAFNYILDVCKFYININKNTESR